MVAKSSGMGYPRVFGPAPPHQLDSALRQASQHAMLDKVQGSTPAACRSAMAVDERRCRPATAPARSRTRHCRGRPPPILSS